MTVIQSGVQIKSNIVPGTLLCIPSIQERCGEQSTVETRIVDICHQVEKMSEKPEGIVLIGDIVGIRPELAAQLTENERNAALRDAIQLEQQKIANDIVLPTLDQLATYNAGMRIFLSSGNVEYTMTHLMEYLGVKLTDHSAIEVVDIRRVPFGQFSMLGFGGMSFRDIKEPGPKEKKTPSIYVGRQGNPVIRGMGFSMKMRMDSATRDYYRDAFFKGVPGDTTIIVGHEAPFGQLDSYRFIRPGEPSHEGSAGITSLLAETQPLVYFTGHLHRNALLVTESNFSVSRGTVIINPEQDSYPYNGQVNGAIVNMAKLHKFRKENNILSPEIAKEAIKPF